MALQSTFKPTLSTLHKNFHENQTRSFRMASRMWHQWKEKKLLERIQRAWRYQTRLSAHRKEPRSTFPCQINAQFLLGKVRTTPPLNPTHHMHNTLWILSNHQGQSTSHTKNQNCQRTCGRSLPLLSRSMRSNSNKREHLYCLLHHKLCTTQTIQCSRHLERKSIVHGHRFCHLHPETHRIINTHWQLSGPIQQRIRWSIPHRRICSCRTQKPCLQHLQRKTMLQSQRFHAQRLRTKNPSFQQRERSRFIRNTTTRRWWWSAHINTPQPTQNHKMFIH